MSPKIDKDWFLAFADHMARSPVKNGIFAFARGDLDGWLQLRQTHPRIWASFPSAFKQEIYQAQRRWTVRQSYKTSGIDFGKYIPPFTKPAPVAFPLDEGIANGV